MGAAVVIAYQLTPAQAVEIVGRGRLRSADVEAHVARYVARLHQDQLPGRGFVNGLAETRIVAAALVSAGVVRDYGSWSNLLARWETICEYSR
jgi:hypothetical protein